MGGILPSDESCILCICMAVHKLLDFEKDAFLIAFCFVGIKGTVQCSCRVMNPVFLFYYCFLL